MLERLIKVKVGSKTYTYRAVFEVDEDGRYVVECPAIEGCYTEGRNLDEAIEMIKDALRLSIESRLEIGEPLPIVIYNKRSPSKMLFDNSEVRFSHVSV